MPLYEYKCTQCNEKVEAIQSFSEAPYTICTHCGGALKKLISAPAIQFKGSGFYITDYGKSGTSESKTSDGKSDSKSEAKSESKSDAGSESKSDSKTAGSTTDTGKKSGGSTSAE